MTSSHNSKGLQSKQSPATLRVIHLVGRQVHLLVAWEILFFVNETLRKLEPPSWKLCNPCVTNIETSRSHETIHDAVSDQNKLLLRQRSVAKNAHSPSSYWRPTNIVLNSSRRQEITGRFYQTPAAAAARWKAAKGNENWPSVRCTSIVKWGGKHPNLFALSTSSYALRFKCRRTYSFLRYDNP